MSVGKTTDISVSNISMTETILKENEFIIRMDGDISKQVLGREELALKLVNPHKPGDYDSTKYEVLKKLLQSLGKTVTILILWLIPVLSHSQDKKAKPEKIYYCNHDSVNRWWDEIEAMIGIDTALRRTKDYWKRRVKDTAYGRAEKAKSDWYWTESEKFMPRGEWDWNTKNYTSKWIVNDTSFTKYYRRGKYWYDTTGMAEARRRKYYYDEETFEVKIDTVLADIYVSVDGKRLTLQALKCVNMSNSLTWKVYKDTLTKRTVKRLETRRGAFEGSVNPVWYLGKDTKKPLSSDIILMGEIASGRPRYGSYMSPADLERDRQYDRDHQNKINMLMLEGMINISQMQLRSVGIMKDMSEIDRDIIKIVEKNIKQ